MKDTTFSFKNFKNCSNFESVFLPNWSTVLQKIVGLYFIEIGYVVPELWPHEGKYRDFNITFNAMSNDSKCKLLNFDSRYLRN